MKCRLLWNCWRMIAFQVAEDACRNKSKQRRKFILSHGEKESSRPNTQRPKSRIGDPTPASLAIS
jgi:hypothetical protein